MPTFIALEQMTKNWSAVPANAYPPQVAATVPIPFDLVINGQKRGSSNAQPGTPVKPLRLVGDILYVGNMRNTNMRSQVNVNQTNFKQLVKARYDKGVTYYKNRTLTQRAEAKKALLAKPDRLAALTSRGPADSSSDSRFNIVKASIKRGDAHPASLEEAKSFKWNGRETVGGELRGTYDTVSVHFEVQTIFGKFPTDYKCLISGGQVKGWIDPITEEKIKK